MAMIKCRECKKKISSECDTCPQCGCPDPRKKPKRISTAKGCGFILLLTIIIVAIITCVSDSDTSSTAVSREDARTSQQSAADKRIEKLDAAARALPSSDIEGNLEAYRALSQLAPDNERYRNKVAHYQKLLDEANNAAKDSSAPLPAYKIVDDVSTGTVKRSVDVRLEARISESDLARIAKKIHRAGYDRTFISYYLPDMTIGNGAWATSHFNPDLEVMILGATADQAAALKKTSPQQAGRTVLGSWMVSGILARRVDMYEDAGGIHVATKFDDGSSMHEMVEERSVGGRKAYVVQDNSFGEYYVINAQGQLEIWDKQGLIDRGVAVE